MNALAELRERMAELSDLAAVEMLLGWDQLVMMPPAGAEARAHQLGALARLRHERATAAQIGGWLAEIDAAVAAGEPMDELDRDIVRIARRDWERARRVPDELASELAQAAAAGQESWRKAREADDFAAFTPALRRNVELARAYAEAVAEDCESAYDALLADYDHGLRTVELRRVFGALGERLPALAAQARVRSPRRTLEVPVSAQRAAVQGTLRRLGVDERGWRVDV